MTDQEMFETMESLITRIVKTEVSESHKQIMTAVKDEAFESRKQIMADVQDKVSESQKQIMKNMAMLMDAQFMKQFNLLADKIDSVMRKMPSEDDMDIIDGTLQEHGEILKVHDQEIEKLKIAL